ncbi:MAG: hypothetical protein P8Y75_08115 [Nitrospirota bacterium]|jgi:hypothetical protein
MKATPLPVLLLAAFVALAALVPWTAGSFLLDTHTSSLRTCHMEESPAGGDASEAFFAITQCVAFRPGEGYRPAALPRLAEDPGWLLSLGVDRPPRS